MQSINLIHLHINKVLIKTLTKNFNIKFCPMPVPTLTPMLTPDMTAIALPVLSYGQAKNTCHRHEEQRHKMYKFLGMTS